MSENTIENSFEKVIIDSCDFAALHRESKQFEILVDLLLEGAELNYRKDGLSFNNEMINLYLRTQFYVKYCRKRYALIKREEIKDELHDRL